SLLPLGLREGIQGWDNYFSSLLTSSHSVSSTSTSTIEILYPVNLEAKLTFKPFFQTALALSVGRI
ncbi:hypothetical protein ACFLY2_01165, partial [Patescibacteria group bacterium]